MIIVRLVNSDLVKVADTRRYNIEKIQQAVKSGRSLKAVKANLCISRFSMYALMNKKGNVITNMNWVVEVVEEFYRELYRSQNKQNDIVRNNDCPEEFDIPPLTTVEVRKALEGMQKGKATGKDKVTMDLLKDGGEIVLEKLATLYTKCLLSKMVQESWKIANIILIYKK